MDANPTYDPDSEFRTWDYWEPTSNITADINLWAQTLRDLESADNAWEAQTRIRALEELSSAIAATQAREALAFHTHRTREDATNDVPQREQGKYAGNEIAVAKRTSPATGRKFLSTARTLITDLPHTYQALTDGCISESTADIIASETAGLTSDQRHTVDEEIKDRLPTTGKRRLRGEARALAAEVSTETADEKAEKAAKDRHVTMRTLRNGMGRITATVPLIQAIAAYEDLHTTAAAIKTDEQGQGRTHSQLMADTFVERLTGQTQATAVPTEVHVVMEAESLFSDGRVPAWLPGYGPLPAKTTRNFLTACKAKTFVRRMFTSPETGQLVGMDSRRRTFNGLLRRMIVFRDDVCRTPWCDAPIKHADHATPAAEGGNTEWSNASGLCEACNYAKEHPGWTHSATADGLRVTTPTGEEYDTAVPPFVTKLSHPSEENPESDEDVIAFANLSTVEDLFREQMLRDTG